MVRVEFVLAGCVLVVAGAACLVLGYQRLQPTVVDQLVSVAEQITGEQMPVDVQSSKQEAYLFLGGGCAAFVLGLVFILISRSKAPGKSASAE